MKRIMIVLLALLIMSVAVIAQDVITIEPIPPVLPPANHVWDCLGNADAVYYVGPNCVNPVLWDLDGMHKVGGYIVFDGGGGYLAGFSWNWRTQTYDYLLVTSVYDLGGGYPGEYEIVARSRVTHP